MVNMRWPILAVLAFVAALFMAAPQSSTIEAQANGGSAKAVPIRGLVEIDGQDAIVEILVAVRSNENAREVAQAVLHRAYPKARELDSAEFATTGLV